MRLWREWVTIFRLWCTGPFDSIGNGSAVDLAASLFFYNADGMQCYALLVNDIHQEDQEVVQEELDDEQEESLPPDNDGNEPRRDTEGHAEEIEEGSEDNEDNKLATGNANVHQENHDDNNQPIPVPILDLEPLPARYNLRPNRERTYNNRSSNSMDSPNSSKSYKAQFLQTGSSPHQGRRE